MDYEKINQLAHRYATHYNAKGGDEEKQRQTFHDLAELCKPIILRRLNKEARGNPWIPREDFESEFWEALFRAAKYYNGDIPFAARLNEFISQAAINLIRHYRCSQIQMEPLDKLLYEDEKETPKTYYDIIPSQENVEGEVLAREIKKTLADYAKSNERNAKIVQFVLHGCTNLEIARSIGANQYDAKTRKIVQRAKEGFKSLLA